MSEASDKAIALAKQSGPGVVLGGVAIALALASGDAAPPDTASVAPRAEKRQPPTREGQATRLVSCGFAPVLLGNDAEGTIAIGTGADGRCTLLFAAPFAGACTITGGSVEKLTESDLVIAADGDAVSYRCEAH